MIRHSLRSALVVLALFGAMSATIAQTVQAPGTPAARAPAQAADVKPAVSAPQQRGEPIAVSDVTPLHPAAGMHDLSPVSMFLAADIVVKAVMVGLMCASLATWTILVGKTIELAVARRRLSAAMARIGEARMIREAQLALHQDGFLSDLLAAATHELDLSGPTGARAGVKERSESRFADRVRVETQSMRRGMGMLATIGSTSPFVGLFGTVWGIMNSFIGISKSQTTNLAVVAPGIAEALLATAIGLVAAIPAVIIYNHFSRATRSYQLLVTRAVGVVTRLLSRELDRSAGPAARAAE